MPGIGKLWLCVEPCKMALAVLPVRERAARLHRVMAETRGHERLVEHELRGREARVDVAERPFA